MTVWHDGERALQRRLGVAERMAEVGPRIIRDFMPDQHREFFAQLPFVVIGSVTINAEGQGDVWATLLTGAPGFVRSPDPRTLTIDAVPALGDPTGEGLGLAGSIGLLGIEPHTRRRNRMNGTITRSTAEGLTIAVEHSFGNCPKYIHPRELAAFAREPGPIETFVGLDARARARIAAADTFFVASYVDIGSARQVDVSHRGGPAGFVQIDPSGLLTIPDYIGNRFFNTLGNLVVQPRVGLVFVDFASGDVLQITGDAELVFEGDPRLAGLVGAERAWTVRPRGGVHRPAALPLHAVR
jgi:predicted pyridoxine 5'-phosphate oxidase superfamily flavin-nucleotide-binding protein